MPSLTVTAVDTGADTLTAAGHGLLTGDRMRLRNLGGALPAAAPALAPVTDYFAIRVDADKVKVATSSANAFAGTAVDLTDAGTGTQLIEYGLPYCVRRISANGSQIFPIDDNEAWNALVALHGLLTGQAQSIWDKVTLDVPFTAAANVYTLSIAPTSGHVGVASGTPLGPVVTHANHVTWLDGDVRWHVPLVGIPVGAELSAVRARVKDCATEPTKLVMSLVSFGPDNTQAQIGADAESDGGGGYQWIEIDLSAVSSPIESGKGYSVAFENDTGSDSATVLEIVALEVEYSTPP